MTAFRFSPGLAAVLFLTASAFAANDVNKSLRTTLDRLVAKNDGHGGGIARVAGPGGVIWQGAAGNVAGPGSAPMTPDTPFEVASITKAVTAATTLRLVEEGKLSLDAKLGSLLPASQIRGFNPNITVRQLLSHTSGLQHYWEDGPVDRSGENAFLRAFMADPNHFWTPDDILGYARDIPAKRPGSSFHYSDTNFVLLGLIIERITGKPLHRVYRTMIFDPLGMNDTWLTYRESRRGAVPSHRFEGSDDLNNVPRQSADWAGGGLMSTARDLEKFLRGLASGRLFRKAGTLDVMRESVPVGESGISYGLGLYRVDLGKGLGEVWGHDGHGNSFAYYWPQRDITFTGTLNQTENDWWPLIEAFIEGDEPGTYFEQTERSFEVSLTAGWDSLYMDRGANALRDGRGYGSGIFWFDVNVVWGITDNDFLTADFWSAFATQGSAYSEFDPSILYTRTIGDLSLSFGYGFDYGVADGNYYSHELDFIASYDIEIGPVTVTPSITYYFNLGPDSADGTGMAKAGSSFLQLRLDGHVPVYRDIIALEPWTAFGVNFSYNTRTDDYVPFNGANNYEVGLSVPFRINRMVSLAIFGAYSLNLNEISATDTNTFWGGGSVTFSY